MNKIYPRCTKSFEIWCSFNPKYNNFYKKIGSPLPFDVTLRDGLQALPRDVQDKYKTSEKLNLYDIIRNKYKPNNIEIGSIVSEKILPVFKDTIDFLNIVNTYLNHYTSLENPIEFQTIQNNYILVPNQKSLLKILNLENIVNNFSFITSVSNSFQIKNTKMSLIE
jgi:hypothetical protein